MANNGENNHGFDLRRRRIGAVYAKGLFAAAQKAGQADRVHDELDAFISDVLDSLPKFEQYLASPTVHPDAKVATLQKAIGGKVSPLFLNGLKVMAEALRLDCLRELQLEYNHLYFISQGRIEVTAITAAEMTDEAASRLQERLSSVLGGETVLRREVDEELIGGLIVRVGDTVYDGSVKYQLARLRSEARESALRQMRQRVGDFVESA